MKIQDFGLDGRKLYFIVLVVGMISTVIAFNTGRELLSAGIITTCVILLFLVKNKSDRPIFDERDISLAEESIHTAFMWTGALGGLAMIVISIGMGLGRWDYPYEIAPYYLTWGGILALSVVIEILKRYKVIE